CQAIMFLSEKDCGEQLLATLAKEANANMKTLMQKLIDNVQKGEIKASQSIINRMDAAQKQYATDNYWVRACLPMKSCLECPVEL
ncbi:hypothetical protein PENTCL1PPCAC_16022, partial [Pristionchus entomophagus]